MGWMTRLNKPWLHFVVLGLILYKLQTAIFPEPKPTVGPLNDARLDAMMQQWFASAGRPPSAEQKARMVRAELDRDMLFQRAIDLELHLYDTVVYQRLLRNMNFLQMAEGKTDTELYEQALDMRLHLGDEVVKRRLIQVMEQLLLASNPPKVPTEEDIAAEFSARKLELRRPPRYSIEHIYFSREREGEVDKAIATVQEQGLSPREARQLSSPFLPGYEFRRQTPDQLARHFGASFVANLEQANPLPEQWTGPLRSTYGLHYVWVSALEVARDALLEEVRLQLQRDLESRARAEALQSAIDTLREDYEVIL
ncbi:MAG: peptidylprolyl isomerase [Halioglobus sp.]